MARIRTIKPEAFVSESLAEVSLTAERTFFGLLTQVDDSGRHRDNAAVLCGAIWPLRPSHTAADVEEDLRQLEKQDLVCRYAGPDGKRYLHLPTFGVHQKISHPTPSKLPFCPRHEGSPGGPREGSGISPEDSGKSPENPAPPTPGAPGNPSGGADVHERAPESRNHGDSGEIPEDSGDSPLARARACAPEVEVEVEVEQGKGELPPPPATLFDADPAAPGTADAGKPRGASKKSRKPPAEPKPKPPADELTDAFWEVHGKGQAQSWAIIRGIVRTCLGNEIPRNDLARALDLLARQGKAISGGTIQNALTEIRRPLQLLPGGASIPSPRVSATARALAEADRAGEEAKRIVYGSAG